MIGFDAAHLALTQTGFRATWTQDCPPFRRGQTIAGQQGLSCGHVLSLVVLPA